MKNFYFLKSKELPVDIIGEKLFKEIDYDPTNTV